MYQFGEWEELGLDPGDDWQYVGQLPLDKVVVVLPVVERVHRQPVEESALVLCLANDEGDLEGCCAFKYVELVCVLTIDEGRSKCWCLGQLPKTFRMRLVNYLPIFWHASKNGNS
jgi:hypothetical protein